MGIRLLGMLLLASMGYGCSGSQQDSQVSEQALQKKTAPYCADGHRDRGCLFGNSDCYLTSAGCKVCQCESLDD